MKNRSNNILVHMKVNNLKIKVEIIWKSSEKKFSVLSLTLILTSINTPMTYLIYTLLNISGLFEKLFGEI